MTPIKTLEERVSEIIHPSVFMRYDSLEHAERAEKETVKTIISLFSSLTEQMIPEEKGVSELFPEGEHKPTPDFSMAVIGKDSYNKAIHEMKERRAKILG